MDVIDLKPMPLLRVITGLEFPRQSDAENYFGTLRYSTCQLKDPRCAWRGLIVFKEPQVRHGYIDAIPVNGHRYCHFIPLIDGETDRVCGVRQPREAAP